MTSVFQKMDECYQHKLLEEIRVQLDHPRLCDHNRIVRRMLKDPIYQELNEATIHEAITLLIERH